jgi:hypothetical protein
MMTIIILKSQETYETEDDDIMRQEPHGKWLEIPGTLSDIIPSVATRVIWQTMER